MLDEERRADRVDVRHRRGFDENGAIMRKRAVFPLACRAPVRRRVLEERDEARDADALDARRPELRLEGERCNHHVAAVRASVDDGSRAVDRRPRAQPRVECRKVAHRVEPLFDVVEMLVPLAVAGRPSHVRRGDRISMRDEILGQRREARREPRQPLRLRPAVHRDDDGKRALPLGLEEEHGNGFAVEALETMQRGLDETPRIDRARARREPHDRFHIDVVEIHVVRFGRAREGERELRPIRREHRMLDHAAAGQRNLGTLSEVQRVVEGQSRVPVFVCDHEQAAATVVAHALEIPVRLDDGYAVDGDRERVTPGIRRQRDCLPEPHRRVELGRGVVRRQVDDVATLRVAEVDVVVSALLADAIDRDPAPVRRDGVDAAIAAELEGLLLPGLDVPRDDVEVDAVPSVRRVRECRSGRARRAVDVARIDDERLEPVPEHVELSALVAAPVELDEHAAVRQKEPAHRLRVIGQLLELTAGGGHDIQLLGPRKVRADEKLRAVGRERERHRLPHLEQRLEHVRR